MSPTLCEKKMLYIFQHLKHPIAIVQFPAESQCSFSPQLTKRGGQKRFLPASSRPPINATSSNILRVFSTLIDIRFTFIQK